MFSPDGIYSRLKDFKSRLPTNGDRTLCVPFSLRGSSCSNLIATSRSFKTQTLLCEGRCTGMLRHDRTNKTIGNSSGVDIRSNAFLAVRKASNGECLSQDAYLIQRYGEVRMSAGKIKRTYVKKAMPEGMFDLHHTWPRA